jgi:hypothetical protein
MAEANGVELTKGSNGIMFESHDLAEENRHLEIANKYALLELNIYRIILIF